MNGDEKLQGPAPLPDSNNLNQAANQRQAGSGAPSSGGPSMPSPAHDLPQPPSSRYTPPPPPPPPPPRPAATAPGAPPSPPAPEIDIRTMASDAQSLKSTGGIGTEPKVFRPSDFATGGQVQKPGVGVIEHSRGAKKRIVAIVVAAAIVLGGVAAAVYFLILPLFAPEPAPIVVAEPPVSEPGQTEAPVSSEQAVFEHQSFFVNPPDIVQTIQLPSVTQAQILAGLQANLAEGAADGTVQEVAFTVEGNPLSSAGILDTLFADAGLSTLFENDFTAFVYYDENGAWPGYIFRLPEGSDATSVAAAVRTAIEGAGLGSLYLADPGDPDAAGFRDGTVNGIATRYRPYSQPGASFNYGWDGNYLVLSTSFAGFKAAVGLLP